MLIRCRAEARIPVPDVRFEWLCDLYKPASRVPAFLTILDIAGLTAVRVRSHPSEIPAALHPSPSDSLLPPMRSGSFNGGRVG